MGAGFSLQDGTPDTYVLPSIGGGDQSSWDHWGYVPSGVLKPAQHISALGFRETGAWTPFGNFTRAMQPTQIFGTDQYDPVAACYDGGCYSGGGSKQNGYVKLVQQPFSATPADNVYFGSEANGPLCTPDIFPACQFSQIGDRNLAVTPLVPVKNDLSLSYVGDVISDQVNAYRFNNLTYVDNLNSQDTSDYVNPCDGPSLLDEILPVAAGVAVVIAKTRFIDPELAALGLPSDATFALTLNAYLAGYYLGKQLVLPFGVDEANGYKAAMCIARGVGYVGTSYFTQNAGLQPLAQLGVSLLSAEIVANVIGVPLAVYIDKTVGLTSAPMRAITTAFRAVQRWLCHFSQGTVIACDDAKAFPDARRWAIAELAAKIVDELCAEEGWQRDSPQAQFAMKSFLANPAWAMAGMNWGTEDNPTTSWEYQDTALNNATWNLTGEVVQTSYWGGQNAGQQWGVSDIQNPDETSVNNNAAGFAKANMIACQNYDILKNGTGKGTSGGDPMLALNFAANLKRWKESVRTKAWDPTNWVAAENVGLGLLSGDDPALMSPQQYLANCNKSLANGGFDDFKTRGEYALLYKQKGTMSEEDWMLIQINQYLAGGMVLNEDSIDVFASRLVAAGVTANLCGCIAYMAREPENGPQRIFWREWTQTENAQVKECFGLLHSDKLSPPLFRTDQKLTPTQQAPILLDPTRYYPIGDHLKYPFGNKIPGNEVQQLVTLWNQDENLPVSTLGATYQSFYGDATAVPNATAFQLASGSGRLLTAFPDINAAWDNLDQSGILASPNAALGLPQGYAIIYALISVRPSTTWNTPLSRSWDAWVAPLTVDREHELQQYANPYAPINT